MSKKKFLPRALGYLRKSTKGATADGRQKQEKSIGAQKTEIEKLVKDRFEIVAWYVDEGVSGWKRGANRPDFQKMIVEAEGHKAQAIVVDNIDRFSRAAVGDVQADANSLRQASVRWIVTASHGDYDLGAKYDIGEILKFTVAVWASCEFSRQLSRRVSLARRNAALKGKRTGGPSPYGMESDGQGGLKHGEPKQVKVVRWIFDRFADHNRSMCSIANELNQKKMTPPRGKAWYTVTVRGILKRKCYKGDFSYNEKPSGEFFRIDGEGEVVQASKINGNGKVFSVKGRYTPVVEPKVFDKAQKRLAIIGKDRSRRKRVGYALSGILVCNHCGSNLYGVKRGKQVVYRCGTVARKGADSCKNYQITEGKILPIIMKLLGEELTDIQAMLTAPPDELRKPYKDRREKAEQAEEDRARLVTQIARAEDNLLASEDKRTRKSLDLRITAMRDELELVEATVATGTQDNEGYTKEDFAALTEWHEQFEKRAVSMPFGGEVHDTAVFWQDPFSEEAAFLLEPMVVNDMLHQLGTQVNLRWTTRKSKTASGNERIRHTLTRGRFRLGQSGGNISKAVLDGSASR